MGSLVVMSSGLGPEGPNLLPDTAKDPSSACGARACKIRGSDCTVISRLQFIIGVVSGEKNFSTVRDISTLRKWRWMMMPFIFADKNWIPAIVKWASHLRNKVALCLKPYNGLGLPSTTRRQQQHRLLITHFKTSLHQQQFNKRGLALLESMYHILAFQGWYGVGCSLVVTEMGETA